MSMIGWYLFFWNTNSGNSELFVIQRFMLHTPCESLRKKY